MLLVFANRHQMVELAGSYPINHMVEFGVFEEEFAEHCFNILDLKRCTLIDFWNYDEYSFGLEEAPQMRRLREAHSQYLWNEPEKTLAAAHDKTRRRFVETRNVELPRMEIAQAASRFANASLDFIYLDANHTYEFVLRVLYTWYPKLRPGGLFVCNDFFGSLGGAEQNLEVMPAFLKFSKRQQTYPVALTSMEWSDFYFSNVPSSDLIAHLRSRICGSRFPVVETPNEFLGAYHHETQHPTKAASLIPGFNFRSTS